MSSTDYVDSEVSLTNVTTAELSCHTHLILILVWHVDIDTLTPTQGLQVLRPRPKNATLQLLRVVFQGPSFNLQGFSVETGMLDALSSHPKTRLC